MSRKLRQGMLSQTSKPDYNKQCLIEHNISNYDKETHKLRKNSILNSKGNIKMNQY